MSVILDCFEIFFKKSREIDECSICFLPLDKKLTTLPCNHIFHKSCIQTWFNYNKKMYLQENSNSMPTCPMCRQVFQKI